MILAWLADKLNVITATMENLLYPYLHLVLLLILVKAVQLALNSWEFSLEATKFESLESSPEEPTIIEAAWTRKKRCWPDRALTRLTEYCADLSMRIDELPQFSTARRFALAQFNEDCCIDGGSFESREDSKGFYYE